MSAHKELRQLVAGVDAAKPDAGAVKQLRSFLADNPEMWRNIGDLAEQANMIMVEDMTAPTAMKESIKYGMGALEKELAQPNDGALEGLIIRQIVGCWLRLSYLEYVYNRNTVAGMSVKQGDHWEKRLNAAQRRYLRAVESLARVRRLRLPSVQVNIGAQQVNQIA